MTFPPKPWIGGPWHTRWCRLLRTVLRSHGKISGERDRIREMGYFAWLRADDVLRNDEFYETFAPKD